MNYLDKDGLLYFWNKFKSLLGGKVDKVDGKGLSTNDYTNDEKTKLAGLSNYTLPKASSTVMGGVKVGSNLAVTSDGVLNATDTTYENATTSTAGLMSSADKTKLNGVATGANANVIESIKVNGTAVSITSKAVDIAVPTKVSSLNNDSEYQTASQVQAAISSAVSGITSFEYTKVTNLPTTGERGKVYLMLNGSNKTKNIYDEYIWLSDSSTYEKIGTTDIDLSGYVLSSDLVAITNSEIDAICK